MNPAWDPEAAVKKMKEMDNELACDALLDQDIFAGVGNKIKDEVLFITRVHPESHVAGIPDKKKREMAEEASKFSFHYMEWEKAGTAKENFQVHFKKICPGYI